MLLLAQCIWPARALGWLKQALVSFNLEVQPLYDPVYKIAREEYSRRFEQRGQNFCFLITFVSSAQIFLDPQPAMQVYFIAQTFVTGGVQHLFPRLPSIQAAVVVLCLFSCTVLRLHLIGDEFFTSGYSTKATWLTLPLTYFFGARAAAAWAVSILLLLGTHFSELSSHSLNNMRVVLLISIFGSALAEAGRIREEAAAATLRERTAEAREFEMQAADAKAKVAQARAAQLAAEAAQAHAGKLQAEDQRRAMERLYHKALTRLKVPLVLARSEMQACNRSSSCPGCQVAEQRLNELWQLLTVPAGAPLQADDNVPAVQQAAADAVQAGVSAPSVSSATSIAWSYDSLEEFQDIAIAFDPESFNLQKVTVRIREPGWQCQRPAPQLDSWVIPEDSTGVLSWMQGQVNAILSGEDVQRHPGPLRLRWLADSFLQANLAYVVWVEDPLDAEQAASQREAKSGDAGSDCSIGSCASYQAGQYTLVLTKLAVPVPARHGRRRHVGRQGSPVRQEGGQVPHLHAVEEFASADESAS